MAEASLAETISYCAQNLVLMEMSYNGVTRLVEVYSYRARSTGTCLYAYCHKDGKMECFRVDRIEHAKATDPEQEGNHFVPRWPVEIT